MKHPARERLLEQIFYHAHRLVDLEENYRQLLASEETPGLELPPSPDLVTEDISTDTPEVVPLAAESAVESVSSPTGEDTPLGDLPQWGTQSTAGEEPAAHTPWQPESAAAPAAFQEPEGGWIAPDLPTRSPLEQKIENRKGMLPYLTEQEYSEPQPRQEIPLHSEPRQRRGGGGFELALGTRWLVAIGGVLLLIGAAYGAARLQTIMTPMMRVAGGYLLAVALIFGGALVSLRHRLVGRSTTAIGLSLGYFISFAGYFLPYTKVYTTAWPAVVMMLGFAAVLVFLAERWRSELMAGYALMLGVIGALISAPTSAHFSLVALGILAVAAGVMLVRNEWIHLTSVSLFSSYASMVILWVVLGAGEVSNALDAHLGALVLYHLIYAAAFWRWSRPWLARERAERYAAEHEPIPTIQHGLLPYSSGFGMLNSLCLIATSLLLLYISQVYWGDVQWLLFGLAAIEAGRLAFRVNHSPTLFQFHLIAAAGLSIAGTVAALSGLAEGIALAVQVLLIVIAGALVPSLRWLRPLAVIPAFLTLLTFNPATPLTVFQYLGAISPGIVLLLSALPWHLYFARQAHDVEPSVSDILERISAAVRSLAAGGMVLILTHGFFRPSGGHLGAILLFGLILVSGSLFLGARAWLVAALGAIALATGEIIIRSPDAGVGLLAVCLLLACIYLWEELLKVYTSLPDRFLQMISLLLGLVFIAPAFYRIIEDTTPWLGLLLITASALLLTIFRFVSTRAGLSTFAVLAKREKRSFRGHLLGPYGRLSVVTGAALAIGGAFAAITVDARISLLSPMILAGFCASYWLYTGRKRDLDTPDSILALILGVGVYTISLFVKMGIRMEPLFLASLSGFALLLFGLWRRNATSYAAGTIQLCFLTVMAIGLIFVPGTGYAGSSAVLGLALAGMMVAARILGNRRLEQGFPAERTVAQGVSAVCMLLGTALLLAVISSRTIFSGMFITVGWGVAGFTLLVVGFATLDKLMRYLAMGVFGFAIVRIVLFDLAGQDTLTRVIAFCGLGILLIISGIGYGLLSKYIDENKRAMPPS